MYPLQVIIYTGVMLLFYMLMLKDRPMHRFNRAYLLLSAFLPMVLPLLKLPEVFRPQVTGGNLINTLPEMVITNEETTVQSTPWLAIIFLSYIVIAAIILLYKLAMYIRLYTIIRRCDKEHRAGYTLLRNIAYGPGSWWKYIFLPGPDENELIIRHELAHIKLRHSADLLLLNVIQVVAWPNLFIHLVKKELIVVHEFQADEVAGTQKETYAKLLVSSVFNSCTLPFTHSFIIHPIKRRIMMLNKKQKAGVTRIAISALTIIVLVSGIVTMQSCEQKQQSVKPIDDYSKVTKMPEYKDTAGIYNYLAKAIKYPKDALDKGIEGRVMVKFVITETGEVDKVQVANADKVDASLAFAAVAAVKGMPEWTPGEMNGKPVPIWYTLPVTFKLDKEQAVNYKAEKSVLSFVDIEAEIKEINKTTAMKRAELGIKPGSSMPLAQEDKNMIISQIHLLLSEANKGHSMRNIVPDDE